MLKQFLNVCGEMKSWVFSNRVSHSPGMIVTSPPEMRQLWKMLFPLLILLYLSGAVKSQVNPGSYVFFSSFYKMRLNDSSCKLYNIKSFSWSFYPKRLGIEWLTQQNNYDNSWISEFEGTQAQILTSSLQYYINWTTFGDINLLWG